MLFNIGGNKIFFGSVSSGKWNKSKNKQMWLHKAEKVLDSKGNARQNKKSTYWMGDVCKQDNW